MTKTALYIRVSTEKQAEHGYSVSGQREELLERCEREGREVVAEVLDGGEKRWTLDRPGIDRLRELAASGEIEEVLAWRWDRFGESPWPEVLAIELEEYGVKLRSLDDGGEGEDADILRVLRSAMAKKERRRTTERSRMGMFSKARRGEISGRALQPRYGFRHVLNERGKAVGYEVDEEKMAHVRRIFSMLGEGESIHAVQREFEQGGVPAPAGGRMWSRTTIRNAVLEDAYLPRAYGELEGLGVPAYVLARLDPEKVYGVSWFGKRRSRYTGKGKARKAELQPRESWIGIPVDLTGAGLERASVERARALVKDNTSPSKVGDREWELSGVLFCGDCGRRMIAYRRARPDGDFHNYYRCRPSSTLAECTNRRSHNAERLEGDAAMMFEAYVGGGKLLELYDQACEEEDRRSGTRGNPGRRAALAQRLEVMARKRRGFQEQQAEGLMTIAELRDRLAEIEEERQGIDAELRAAEDAAGARRRQQDGRAIMRALIQQGQGYLLKPGGEKRREFRMFGVRFEVGAEGKLGMRLELDPESMNSLHPERTSS